MAALRREARRRYKKSLLITGFLLLVCFAFMVWSIVTGSALDDLLIATADYSPFTFWTGILLPILAPFLILFMIRGYVHLPREADPPFQQKPTQVPPPLHKAAFFLRQGLGSILCLFLLMQPLLPNLPIYSPVTLSRSEWDALPYPLLQDLEGQSVNDSLVFRGQHLLAPSLLEVRQYTESNSYQLHVYRTRTPWVASWFTRGCLSYFGHQYTVGEHRDHTDSLPPHHLDFAAYYTVTAPVDSPRSFTWHILILRKGDTVIEVDYEGPFELSSLLPQFTNALKSA